MALADIWAAANDQDYQGRCMAALWVHARKVTLKEDPKAEGAADRRNWALSVLRGHAKLTGKQLVLALVSDGALNSKANPMTATDEEIMTQVGAALDSIMEIG